MGHSNSSLNTFQYCQSKYNHNYVLKSEPCKEPSIHFVFGTFAHEVLYKAGMLRDGEGFIHDYTDCIPPEIVGQELKNYFGITSWHEYFTTACKEIAKYETSLCKSLGGDIVIEREVKISMPVAKQPYSHDMQIDEPLTGVIDLLLYNNDSAIIIDYKFSTSRKDQDDFDMNSQLYFYAYMIHHTYNIPLNNIQIGYIDIPKSQFGRPTLLKNGTLSRDKNQNVSQDIYIEAVKLLHPEDADEMLSEGGHYYNIVQELATKKPAYLQVQYLELDAYNGIIKSMLNTAALIEYISKNNLPYVEQHSAYYCKGCEYLTACKPWLTVCNDDADIYKEKML